MCGERHVYQNFTSTNFCKSYLNIFIPSLYPSLMLFSSHNLAHNHKLQIHRFIQSLFAGGYNANQFNVYVMKSVTGKIKTLQQLNQSPKKNLHQSHLMMFSKKVSKMSLAFIYLQKNPLYFASQDWQTTSIPFVSAYSFTYKQTRMDLCFCTT